MKISRTTLNKYLERERITKKKFAEILEFDYTTLFKVLAYEKPISKSLMTKLEEYFNNENAM